MRPAERCLPPMISVQDSRYKNWYKKAGAKYTCATAFLVQNSFHAYMFLPEIKPWA